VLGVSPAGQREDDPLHPVDAAAEFRSCSERIVNALTLVTPPGHTPADWALPAAAARLDVRTRPGTAFVVMWLSPDQPEPVDVSDTIRRCCQAFDITAIRADEIEHADVITDRIREEIRTAAILIVDLTGERPRFLVSTRWVTLPITLLLCSGPKGIWVHGTTACGTSDAKSRSAPRFRMRGHWSRATWRTSRRRRYLQVSYGGSILFTPSARAKRLHAVAVFGVRLVVKANPRIHRWRSSASARRSIFAHARPVGEPTPAAYGRGLRTRPCRAHGPASP
jgi:hypothetical protein